MKKTLKVLVVVCLVVAGLLLLFALIGPWRYDTWDHGLPPDRIARRQFESHRADYIRFAKLLRKDGVRTCIDRDGKVDLDGIHSRFVPEYRNLMHKIGAKFVKIGKDGSMEFELWGHGGAIMSDSYMGVRYDPNDHAAEPVVSRPTVVASLDSEKLPQEHGSVASGYYVAPVEPQWFVYRFEYEE